MKKTEVTVARVYIMESSGLLKSILAYLQTEAKLKGVSVFRAITGLGTTGLHTSSLVDLSLDLPLIVEFFDQPSKVDEALEYLSTIVNPEHIVAWNAFTND